MDELNSKDFDFIVEWKQQLFYQFNKNKHRNSDNKKQELNIIKAILQDGQTDNIIDLFVGLKEKKQQQPQQQEQPNRQSNNNIDIVVEYFGNNDNGDTLKILCHMIKNNQINKLLKYKNFLLDKNDKNEIDDSEQIDIDKVNMIIDCLNNTDNVEMIENIFDMIGNDSNENKNDNIENPEIENENNNDNDNENNLIENMNENENEIIDNDIVENENKNDINTQPRVMKFGEKKKYVWIVIQ